MAVYYARIGDEVVGPLTAFELREAAIASAVAPTTEVATDPSGKWLAAGRVKRLFHESGKVKPHPPDRKIPTWHIDSATTGLASFTLSELIELARQDKIHAETPVRGSEGGGWTAAGSLSPLLTLKALQRSVPETEMEDGDDTPADCPVIRVESSKLVETGLACADPAPKSRLRILVRSGFVACTCFLTFALVVGIAGTGLHQHDGGTSMRRLCFLVFVGCVGLASSLVFCTQLWKALQEPRRGKPRRQKRPELLCPHCAHDVSNISAVASSDAVCPYCTKRFAPTDTEIAWFDRQIIKTPLSSLIIVMICANGLALILGAVGLAICRHPRARDRARILLVAGVGMYVIAFLILLISFALQ